MLMLGTELTQMPAWYVDLSHAQAMEALSMQGPDAAGIQRLKQGMHKSLTPEPKPALLCTYCAGSDQAARVTCEQVLDTSWCSMHLVCCQLAAWYVDRGRLRRWCIPC